MVRTGFELAEGLSDSLFERAGLFDQLSLGPVERADSAALWSQALSQLERSAALVP